MEALRQKMDKDLKDSLKNGDALRTSVLRMASAAVHNKEIQLQKKEEGLSDEEIIEILRSEVKKRKDAVAEFKKGGREDMAEKEAKEEKMLSEYLPPEMPDDELIRVLKDGLRESGAKEAKDFGKVMKVIMPILKGRATGDRVSKALKELLG